MLQPYAYVFDASSLTDGANYGRLQLPMTDLERVPFLLTRISGLNRVAAAMQLYRPGSWDSLFSAPARIGAEYLLSAPLVVQSSQSLVFDLQTVARQVGACGADPIYTSYLTFFGGRAVPGDREAAGPASPAKRLPYTYRFDLSIDWWRYVSVPGGPNERPRVFEIAIDKTFDFELGRIRIRRSDGVAADTDFAVQLLDPLRYHTSSAPLLAGSINELVRRACVFPVPTMTYRRGTALRFEITSLLCNSTVVLPQTYEISFEGWQCL